MIRAILVLPGNEDVQDFWERQLVRGDLLRVSHACKGYVDRNVSARKGGRGLLAHDEWQGRVSRRSDDVKLANHRLQPAALKLNPGGKLCAFSVRAFRLSLW